MTQSTLDIPYNRSTPFYRDSRVLAILAQVLFLLGLILVGWFLYNNVSTNLAAAGRSFKWDFLGQTAGFAIAEGPAFLPSDTYRRAFVIGAINTLRVAGVGILLAFLLGLFVGIARLSRNWLLRTLAMFYVEIIRNTPLLVQLFFWYFGVILGLPDIKERIYLPDLLIISNRGIQLAWPYLTSAGSAITGWLWGAVLVALVASWLQRRRLQAQGKVGSGFVWGGSAFLLVVVIGYLFTTITASLPAQISVDLKRGDRGTLYVDDNGNGKYDNNIDSPMRHIPVTLLDANQAPLATASTDSDGAFIFVDLGDNKGTSVTWQTPVPIVISRPVLQGFNVRGGLPIKPEYAGLLLGLVVYTAAFIAEIVRAGINSVDKGQWEASRALGLSMSETLRMIVLPQALRVAIPPLTSQFLNLTKNSSLALAVGYPDLFSISQTIINQSGAELQVILILMATYLCFSLTTSAFTNWYNKRIALRER